MSTQAALSSLVSKHGLHLKRLSRNLRRCKCLIIDYYNTNTVSLEGFGTHFRSLQLLKYTKLNPYSVQRLINSPRTSDESLRSLLNSTLSISYGCSSLSPPNQCSL